MYSVRLPSRLVEMIYIILYKEESKGLGGPRRFNVVCFTSEAQTKKSIVRI